LSQLRAEQTKLEDILANPGTLKRTLIKEIEADAKQHGDERRTLIQEEKRAVLEVRIVDEPVTVVVSQKGWARALKGHDVEANGLSFKAGDGLYGVFNCRSVDQLYVFGSRGRVYSVPVAGLPGGRGDGQPITSLIDLESGTQIAHYIAGSAAQMLMLANSGGYGLLARLGDLASRQKAGKNFLTLEEGETLLPPVTVQPEQVNVACLADSGRLLVFPLNELKLQPKGGKGLTLMDVDAKDPLVSVAVCAEALRVIGAGRGGKPKDEMVKGVAFASHVGKRARKGSKVDAVLKPARVLAP
jgi:topoisomerase IV subunit A